jgi:glycosyltransferase involved in cell wall biosynthesis
MKKILVFNDFFLPGFKAGGPIHSINNITIALHKHYEFYIVCKNYDVIKKDVYKIQTGVFHTTKHYKINYLNDRELNTINIKKIINEVAPNIIYINSFFSFKSSIQIAHILVDKKIKIIVAPRGEFSKGALNIKRLKKSIYITYSKLNNFYKRVLFHASNEREKEDILKIFPNSNIIVAADLIKLPQTDYKQSYNKESNKLRLCFISRIVPIKNLLHAIAVVHKLKEINVDIIFDIYGTKDDMNYWRKCENTIQALKLNNSIKYINELLPDEIYKTASKYDLLLLPTKGENFGHIIFESLSVGTPVIISNNTMWHSIENFYRHSFSYDIDKIDVVVEYLFRFKDINGKEYRKISEFAKGFAKEFYENQNLNEKMKTVFEC